MRKSFDTFSGTLDPSLSVAINDPETEFGVAIRKPAFVKSAVFVSDQGHAMTDTSDLEQCSALTIGGTTMPRLSHVPKQAQDCCPRNLILTPSLMRNWAMPCVKATKRFCRATYGGRLGLASVTEATVAETTDLSGNAEKFRLDLLAEPGEFGGAVLDQSGNLTGILVSQDETGRVLPNNVNFAAATNALVSMMQSAGLRLSSGATQRLDDVALIASAQNILTPIECWID